MPDYHRSPKEISLLAQEKNKHRRRWQRTRNPAKSAFNRAADKLHCDMQAFCRRCWELTVTKMTDAEPSNLSVYRVLTYLQSRRKVRDLAVCL